MFRLIGFLIGSATSVFIILLIIGMPTFHLNDDDEAQQRYDAAIEKLREKQDEFESFQKTRHLKKNRCGHLHSRRFKHIRSHS